VSETPQQATYRPTVNFAWSPELWRFMQDRAFFTGILGPVGSGKSHACCTKMMAIACQQEPDKDGWRRTRWASIRNTYGELRQTTIKTWLELFPEAHCGPMQWSQPIIHHIKVPPSRGPKGELIPGLDMEVIFLALDKAEDVKKLKSLDLTGAWINEACELPKEILDMLTGRVGRFPSAGIVPATWAGVLADTNASDDTNWWHKAETGTGLNLDLDPEIFGGLQVDFSYRFYRQPPAVLECQQHGEMFSTCEPGFKPKLIAANRVVPAAGRWWTVNFTFGADRYVPGDAENIPNLRAGYYFQQIANKSLAWINRFLQAKCVYLVDGKPWIPEYVDEVFKGVLTAIHDLPLKGGIDIGGGTLNPAALIGQRGAVGDWRCLRELSLFDTGLEVFSTRLRQFIDEQFPKHKGFQEPLFTIDPASKTRDPLYAVAVEEHLRTRKFRVQLAATNAKGLRRDALALPMGRMINIGEGRVVPGFRVDESCTMLRQGLSGKWARKKVQAKGDDRYSEEPTKNAWSHVCDAAGYMVVNEELPLLTHNRKPNATAQTAHAMAEAQNNFAAGRTWQMNTDFKVF
jgi:hypothetical protein